MNISRADNNPVLIQMDPDFSANSTRVQIANAVAVKQAKVSKQVAETALQLVESAAQTSSSPAKTRGIDVRA